MSLQANRNEVKVMILTIKQARLIKGFTQTDMAQHLKVHVQTYRNMENHPDEVTVGNAKKICDLLEISYDQIFFNVDSTLSRVEGGVTLEM
ncbi:helix-turn-helix transcriptional regulator [Bacillus cereus group sp. TH152-1LC]|uniref:helix-turn-helix transcriptional regulator n=1 Tax=Bacillus cereus group sp. TH152-1LC TaxID=3018060 RepID=UPI0022E487D7|nr:helix-turn-helix transcriptional regulator [Bacillus cereus group sp. TH152-1LC]MDA1679455.1 helix-turn-helix transcriptional regulator [Bacillus cereus group sp. TH152-1LC]